MGWDRNQIRIPIVAGNPIVAVWRKAIRRINHLLCAEHLAECSSQLFAVHVFHLLKINSL